MTKIFFDTEFTGLHKNTTLISIGMASDCGRKFYAELDDFDLSQANDWIEENVTSKLWIRNPEVMTPAEVEYHVGNASDIRADIDGWLSQFKTVEMWSDCLSYDWVLFCGLFGHAFNIPKNVYYIPFDISTLLKIKGIDPDINREEFSQEKVGMAKHNALWDALITKACYEKAVAL